MLGSLEPGGSQERAVGTADSLPWKRQRRGRDEYERQKVKYIVRRSAEGEKY